MNLGDCLIDHFSRWTKDTKMLLGELIVLDQFLAGVLEDISVWLKERRPECLQVAMALADDYALASGSGRAMGRKILVGDLPVPPQGGNR